MPRSVEQVLKGIIGDYVVQIAALQAKIEELQEIIEKSITKLDEKIDKLDGKEKEK